jgi:ribosome-binding factor A
LPCAEVADDDGVDPRISFRRASWPAVDRKAQQLCTEVARTLGAVLAGECDDDLLRDLIVVSVVPAPSTARLLAVVSWSGPPGQFDPAQIMERLSRFARKLRAEVAAAVRRRKAPELTFRLLPPGESGAGGGRLPGKV